METIRLELPADASPGRADRVLAELLPELSRSGAQKLLEQGSVRLAGKPVKKNQQLTPGAVLEVTLPDPEPIEALPQNIPLDIRYEDASVVVVNKPRGMVVHPAPGNPDGTLVNALLYHCGSSLSGIGGAFRPGIVHRIDKDTSGLLIVAKNDRAHQSLSDQLKDRSLSRTYEAVVIGSLKEDRGRVEAPIDRHPKDRKKMAVVPGGRPAVTHYQVIARYPGFTHVRCKLETGRTHQIRVHMAHLGHPVAGDPVYGPGNDRTGLQGQCLHARELRFVHPDSGELVTVQCDLPEYFVKFLEKIGKTYGQV